MRLNAREDLAGAPQGRASQAQGAVWLAADGGVDAIAAHFNFQLGHWLTYSALVPACNAARLQLTETERRVVAEQFARSGLRLNQRPS